jgi:hypothetical protein
VGGVLGWPNGFFVQQQRHADQIRKASKLKGGIPLVVP